MYEQWRPREIRQRGRSRDQSARGWLFKQHKANIKIEETDEE